MTLIRITQQLVLHNLTLKQEIQRASLSLSKKHSFSLIDPDRT